MIDRDGYRPNVAIVLCNSRNQVFWGKRIKEHAWQFPQGGIKPGETPEQAMYRELQEETGLEPQHVKILGRTREWLHYNVPIHWVKREWRGTYKGQKQIWFLLRLVGPRLRHQPARERAIPSSTRGAGTTTGCPLEAVIDFKREVYRLGARAARRLPRGGRARSSGISPYGRRRSPARAAPAADFTPAHRRLRRLAPLQKPRTVEGITSAATAPITTTSTIATMITTTV